MEEFETDIDYDENIPEGFRAVQHTLDIFVEINYATAQSAMAEMKFTHDELAHHRGKVLDIIRNNPPLESVPKYFRDGREDYLWYSDFYYDVPKAIWRQYNQFITPSTEIHKSNYAEELAKIDLPYFRELVDLVVLERLCIDYEKMFPTQKSKEDIEELPNKKESTTKRSKQDPPKRPYESNLNKQQYTPLVKCIEQMKLFRRPVKVGLLRKLFAGKLPEPLQVANQKSLVYLLDQLMEAGYIKDTWIAVAVGNKDFISFRTEGNKQRYGDKIHYISMEQMMNCRNRNKKEWVEGLENIDELIEELNKYKLE